MSEFNFYVGHGRHWAFFEESGRSNAELMTHFDPIYRGDNSFEIYRDGTTRLLREADAELGIVLLIRDSVIRSAYPDVMTGHEWPATIRDVYEWPDGDEAQLIGTCYPAAIKWFDTRYVQNRSRYRNLPTTATLSVSALAYQVWPTEFDTAEQESRMGGMKAYLPVSDQGDYVASADEIQFVSHVEAVRATDFHGLSMTVYTVTIALPDDFPMRLNVYAPPSAAAQSFGIGDRISGVCWLFGSVTM
jgi:hypothetical protein